MNVSKLKPIPIDAAFNVEQEKTEDKTNTQNSAFTKLKARALQNKVDTHPRMSSSIFQSTLTDSDALVDRILNLCNAAPK